MNDDPYMVLARALHDIDHGHATAFDDCPIREVEIADAIDVLGRLASDDWVLVNRPVGVAPMGL